MEASEWMIRCGGSERGLNGEIESDNSLTSGDGWMRMEPKRMGGVAPKKTVPEAPFSLGFQVQRTVFRQNLC